MTMKLKMTKIEVILITEVEEEEGKGDEPLPVDLIVDDAINRIEDYVTYGTNVSHEETFEFPDQPDADDDPDGQSKWYDSLNKKVEINLGLS